MSKLDCLFSVGALLIAICSMDSRIAILGANGTGKSTLLHLITGALQPCEGTISKHVSLKLAKYSQHSADQLPYDKTPIEYLDAMYHAKFPEKDLMVCNRGAPLRRRLLNIYRPPSSPSFLQAWRAQLGRFGVSGSHQTSPIKNLSDGLRNRYAHPLIH